MPKIEEATHLIEDKLLSWAEEFIRLLPNLVLAAVIVVAGWLLARLVRKGVGKLVGRATDSRTLRRLIANSMYLLVLLVGLFGALSVLHLDKTVTSMLAGAGIIGLALGFAFQDIAANFLSGVVMAVQRPLRTGELVETSGHLGVVEHIDLRTTELRNMQGLQVIVPNKDIFQSALINYTRNGSRRVDLSVGTSYGDDLEKVERITIEAVQGIGDLVPDKEVELFFNEFGDSSINHEVRFWIEAKGNKHYNDMRSRAIKAIKAAYDREGIMIPFPIRTLDFGIKGGEKLDSMLGGRQRG
ncbi:MAG: mechanosensitive ion channel [Flavobacteriales bacterium]|jgi:small conductance mechanosensitive channel|nr:mechanosensitive ion channel [Flavobacteriales bacterium]MCI1751928.1 mechanosensitive ion channel [Flavobacteriales bacterium]